METFEFVDNWVMLSKHWERLTNSLTEVLSISCFFSYNLLLRERGGGHNWEKIFYWFVSAHLGNLKQ